jgi:hypothetical protein
MKTSSGARPLSRAKARNCALINQLATPGLGSCMAGRWVAGLGQLLLALAGSAMIIGWFVLVARNTYDLWVNETEPKPVGWLGGAGGLTLLVAWLWALVTSFQLLRSAKPDPQGKEPPRLTDLDP